MLGSSIVPPIAEESPIAVSATTDSSIGDQMSHEASTSNEGSTITEPPENLNRGEEQNIIETMDADACVLRQRRLAFYDNWTSANRGITSKKNKYIVGFLLLFVYR